MYQSPANRSFVAVIWFIVRVPVLSVLMALVEPRVSTSVRLRTMALESASRRAPKESIPWTKVGMPVGMAEMATATPSRRRSSRGRPRAAPMATTIASAVQATTPSHLVSPSSCCWSGDFVRSTDCRSPAILPTSVSMPVVVTTTEPVPRVTEVFWKTMSVRSPSGVSPPSTTPASFGMGALSPVRAASWVSRLAARMSRPSAATMSPDSTASRSPGTTSMAGMATSVPSRITRASGTCIWARASTLARAASS